MYTAFIIASMILELHMSCSYYYNSSYPLLGVILEDLETAVLPLYTSPASRSEGVDFPYESLS
jgi:hypothetical protein